MAQTLFVWGSLENLAYFITISKTFHIDFLMILYYASDGYYITLAYLQMTKMAKNKPRPKGETMD